MGQVQRIGLTGGIGSGKSTVARAWESLGAVLVDTDAIAHSLTQPGGRAIDLLIGQFGRNIIDASGAMDRQAMRALVFTDPKAKSTLEAILHPLIGQACEEQAAQAQGRIVVFDVPLLVESRHWRDRVDRVVVVDASTETQIRRVMARSGWARDVVEKVIAQQIGRTERRAAADAVIFNEGKSISTLDDEVSQLWARWSTEG